MGALALIRVTDRDGMEHEVEGNTSFTLMENLRDLEYGVAAVCGGMCACATCHVYIDPEWLPQAAARAFGRKGSAARPLDLPGQFAAVLPDQSSPRPLPALQLRIADDE